RGQWRQARRCFRQALRSNRRYLPAEQNLRRIYELETFGRTRLPVAVIDKTSLIQIRNLWSGRLPHELDRLDALKNDSPSVPADATIPSVKKTRWDWSGYAWAIGLVAAATAVGWPLV